jgi:ABC-type sugar transport system substrate-binding protein
MKELIRKGTLVLLVALLMTGSLFAAGGKQEAKGSDVVNIGISLDNLDDPYWVGLKIGIDRAVAELGSNVSVDMQICQGDAVTQARQIQNMVAAGADAIVCVYVDQEAIKQSIRLCNDNNIPFIYSDRPVDSTPGAKVAWGIATDDFSLSKNGWLWMVDYAKKNNMNLKVLELVGSLTDANVLKRTRGFEDVMASNGAIVQRVQSVPTEWNQEKALAGVTNALQANPDINCIFMHSDVLLAPTIQALEAAGRWVPVGGRGHVIVMPYSGNSLSLKSMNDKYVEFCFGMNTINNGYQSVMAAYSIVKGNAAQYSKVVDDPGFLITMDDFAQKAPMAYGYEGFKSGN